jgi:hypothetical protein
MADRTDASSSGERVAHRPSHLAPRVVFVDGIEGCGKTMLSPIVAALDRVELLTFAYEIEYAYALRYLDKITEDGAAAMISLLTDVQLYNTMQSRAINFRPGDLSSVWRAPQPWRYVRRLFQPGDAQAAERIKEQDPILLLTTHKLIAFCEPVFAALLDRVVLIEVVRHPLYMLVQNTINFQGLISSPRDFTIHYDYQGTNLPFFVFGWEKRYLSASPIERAIYYIEHLTNRSRMMRDMARTRYPGQIVTVPFEEYVLRPEPLMRELERALGTKVTPHTIKTMKQQKVPRQRIADSISLAVYRRCGWEPPRPGLSEQEELEHRRLWAEGQASPEAMDVLHQLCDAYDETYMGGRLRQANGRYA